MSRIYFGKYYTDRVAVVVQFVGRIHKPYRYKIQEEENEKF